MDTATQCLIVTTLPHLIAAAQPGLPSLYVAIVVTSTALSVAWHASPSGASHAGAFTSTLGRLDHAVAALWFAAVCYYLWPFASPYFAKTLYLNISVTVVSMVVSFLDEINILPYAVGHSAWHLLSAAKAITVADFIAKAAHP